jgi:AraC-like DNA-binding protein
MTLNGPTNSIDSDREAVAPGDTVRRIPEEYRPSIDELLLSAREDLARLAQILRRLHCSAVLRGMDGGRSPYAELWMPIFGADGEPIAALSGRADGDSWNVLVTPPDLGASSEIDERAILHARPRLDSISCARGPLVQGTCQSGLAPRILRRVEEYIDAHLDSALNIAELAASVGISVSHFSRSFFHSVGLTPHRYVMRRRLTRAHDLLARTDLAVAEVALATGFADQSHFCRRFREFTGLPPRSFRMQHRQLGAESLAGLATMAARSRDVASRLRAKADTPTSRPLCAPSVR